MTNSGTKTQVNSSSSIAKSGLWNRVKNVFGPNQSETSEKGGKEDTGEDYQDIFGDIAKMLVIRVEDDIAITKQNLVRDLQNIAGGFNALGEKDGDKEQKQYAIYDIVNTRVLQLRDYIESTFQSEHDKASVEVDTRQAIFETAKEDYNDLLNYSKELKKSYYKDFKRFSLALGWIYLIVAVLLVIADIPLAVKLAGEGFQLKGWESIAMSTGIALCTVYIKIFYDEFVGNPIEKTITQFKDLPRIDYTENSNELKKLNRYWLWRLILKTSILLFSLITIIVLGFFRFQFYQATLSQFNNAGIDTSLYFNETTQLAFILITLLFPLIGGVCASLGFDKIQNYRELKNIDDKCNQKAIEKLRASKILKEAKKRLQNCKSYLKWCGKLEDNEKPTEDDLMQDFVKTYTSNFLSWYVHGYERGMTAKNLKLDFFEKAEEFRQRLLAQKTEKITQNITAEQFYENLKGLQNENQNN